MKSSPRSLVALARTLLLICASLCSVTSFAQSYRVTVDTRSIAGTTGYVDLQFNPADLTAPERGAWVTDWSGSASLLDTPALEGSVTGALPATVSMSNQTAFNDYFQATRFGDFLSFVVQFNEETSPDPVSLGTSFALALYAADAMSPLLTSHISGSLVRFDLFGAITSYETLSSFAEVAPVPLPAAAWLLLSGLTGLVGLSRARRLK